MSIEKFNFHDIAKERRDLRAELRDSSGKDWQEHKKEADGVVATSHDDILKSIKAGTLVDLNLTTNDSGDHLKIRIKELDAQAAEFSLKNKDQVDSVRRMRSVERVDEAKYAEVSGELLNLENLRDTLQKEEFGLVKKARGQFSHGDKMRLGQIVDIAKAINERIEALGNDPEKYVYCRMHELASNQREIKEFGFAAKPSHKEDMEWVKKRWEEGAPVLLEGATGTGKTELLTYMARKLYGQNPEVLRCTERTGPAEIFGKTLLKSSESGGTETFFQPGRYTTAVDSGVPLLMDEFNQMPTNMRFSLKELYNRKTGEEVKIQEDSGIAHEIQEGFVWAATANIKSGKHKERFDLDAAESRVFEMKSIGYMPADELYDLAIVSLMDRQGEAPLSVAEAQTALKHLIDAAKEIQSGYSDELGNHYGVSGSRGEKPSLEKAVLDPGLVLRIVSGYKTEAPRGVSLLDYLDERLLDFVSKGDYPDKDRELLIRILMSKGFFQDTKAVEFNLKTIKEDTLKPFRTTDKSDKEKDMGEKKITLKQIAMLDPFGVRAARFSDLGDGFLGDGDLNQGNKNEQELSGEFIGFHDVVNWLKTENLEHKLDGDSFEALINTQEQFYQKSYGTDFKLDRSKIRIEKSRLQRIKAGLENGSTNFPLINVIPENLSEAEKQMTEAEFAYHKLLAPLKNDELKIWAETGNTARWTKLSLAEVLKSYIPVEIADFDIQDLDTNWQEEIIRIIEKKKSAPKIQPGKITLTFTDNRQNIPQNQKVINQDGQEVTNTYSFVEMIKNKVNILSPEQWITLAAQLYAKDKTYLSANNWDWMMAVLKNGPGSEEPVSAANANSDSDGVYLNSRKASGDNDYLRWRGAL